MRRFFQAFALCVILSVGPTHAQNSAKCTKAEGIQSFEDVIRACNNLLRGRLSRDQRANILFARAQWQHDFKPDQALRDVNQSLRLNVSNAEAYLLRAGLLPSSRKSQAIEDLTRAIELPAPNWVKAKAYFQRGYMRHSSGGRDLAIADYTQAISLSDPVKNPIAETHHWRARAWEELGDLNAAESDFSAAISYSPTYAFYYSRRAGLRAKLQDLDGAIADYDVALKNSGSPDDYVARAALHEKKGAIENAIADYRKAGASNSFAATNVIRLTNALAQRETKQKFLASVSENPSERRIALIIGNSDYTHAPRCANPRGDAQVLATTLRQLGFSSVTLRLDLRRDRLIDELKAFARAAADADWAVIYFAGHGLEIGGVNYLIPIDAQLASDRDVTFEAVSLEHVLQAIDGAKKLRLAVLDACRDNPFVKTMSRTIATRSIGRGLALLEPQRATLVAYAARHGQVALDGNGGNSPYVSALIKNLKVPGLEISLLFRKVRDEVLATTDNAQEPFTYGSLPSEAFYFRKPQ